MADNEKTTNTNETNSQTKDTITLTSKELEERIAIIRKEEKAKLYSQLEKMEKETKERDAKLKAQDEKISGFEKTLSNLQKVFIPETKETDKFDPNVFNEYMKTHSQKMSEYQQELERQKVENSKLSEIVRTNQIRDTQARLVKEAIEKDKKVFFPELVTGNTEEEIKNSIAQSELLAKKYLGKSEADKKALEDKLKEQQNLTNAVAAMTTIPSTKDFQKTGNVDEDNINMYVAKILEGKIHVNSIPDSDWKKYGNEIDKRVIKYSKNLVEQSPLQVQLDSARQGFDSARTRYGYKEKRH